MEHAMNYVTACPRCSVRVQIPASLLGKQVICPNPECRLNFAVPPPSQQAVSVPLVSVDKSGIAGTFQDANSPTSRPRSHRRNTPWGTIVALLALLVATGGGLVWYFELVPTGPPNFEAAANVATAESPPQVKPIPETSAERAVVGAIDGNANKPPPLSKSTKSNGPSVSTSLAPSARAEEPKLPTVALVIAGVGIPAVSEKPIEEVLKRLDEAADSEPNDALSAAIAGAKTSGKLAGIAFDPVIVLDKGQSPRSTIESLSNDVNLVLLLRGSSRTLQFGSGRPALWLLFDAAIIQRPGLSVVASDGFVGIDFFEEGQAQDKKVDTTTWTRKAVAAFIGKFDPLIMSHLQSHLQKDELERDRNLLMGGNLQSIEVARGELEGGAEREPELKMSCPPDKSQMTLYVQSPNKLLRRWRLTPGDELRIIIAPGAYSLWAQTERRITGATPEYWHGSFTAQFKGEYSIRLSN